MIGRFSGPVPLLWSQSRNLYTKGLQSWSISPDARRSNVERKTTTTLQLHSRYLTIQTKHVFIEPRSNIYFIWTKQDTRLIRSLRPSYSWTRSLHILFSTTELLITDSLSIKIFWEVYAFGLPRTSRTLSFISPGTDHTSINLI